MLKSFGVIFLLFLNITLCRVARHYGTVFSSRGGKILTGFQVQAKYAFTLIHFFTFIVQASKFSAIGGSGVRKIFFYFSRL